MRRAAAALAFLLPVLSAGSPASARTPAVMQPYYTALKRTCPAKHLELLPPGTLIDDVQDFPRSLPPGLRRKFERTLQPALSRCRHRDGASCDNAATLSVMEKLRLTRRFAARVCTAHLTCRAQSDCD